MKRRHQTDVASFSPFVFIKDFTLERRARRKGRERITEELFATTGKQEAISKKQGPTSEKQSGFLFFRGRTLFWVAACETAQRTIVA